MLNLISNFTTSENGAVTIDFVVLTAAIVGLGFAVIGLIGPEAVDKSRAISAVMDNHDANPPF